MPPEGGGIPGFSDWLGLGSGHFESLRGVCCVVRAVLLEGHHHDHRDSRSEALAASIIVEENVGADTVAQALSVIAKRFSRDCHQISLNSWCSLELR